MKTCALSTPPTTESGSGGWSWPSMVKVIVPVGVPLYPGAATTAVMTTSSSTVDGFSEDDTVVVDACGLVGEQFTVWVGSDPVAVPERTSPLYTPRPNASLR